MAVETRKNIVLTPSNSWKVRQAYLGSIDFMDI